MFILTILLVVTIFIVKNTAIIIPTRESGVQERLGKFHQVLNPGLHFLIPFIDRVAYRQELREQVIIVPAQSCITRDNIQVEVDGLVYLKVMDPYLASYGIENYQLASINLAQTTMRSEIGKLDLHQTFAERESLNHKVVEEIDKAASKSWGIKVLRYEIMNLTPSREVIHTLERAMEAERERRAQVTLATAEKEAVANISEGKKQEAINVSEGEKQRRINEADGRAQEIHIVAEAMSYGLKKVSEAINKPGGDQAIQMKIVEQFIEEFGKITKDAQISVVPSQMANIKGVFEGIQKVTNSLEK